MPSESTKLMFKYGLRILNMVAEQMERRDLPRELRDGDGLPNFVYDFIRTVEEITEEEEKENLQSEMATSMQTNQDDGDSDSESVATFHSAHSDFESEPGLLTVPEAITHRTDFENAQSSSEPGLSTVSGVITLLIKHGCKDVSSRIDWNSIGDFRSGGFGDVYKASFLDGTLVAVKTPIISGQLTVDHMQAFLKKAAHELHTWQKCHHPNVLKLLGVTEFRGKIGMVSRWATNGSLQDYIRQETSANRCDLSTQVCEGLAYLHANNTVHGDLKAANAVVSANGVPMISDFGHSFLSDCSLPVSPTSHAAIGTMRWTAPEIIKQETKRSFQGDVYSLGMTILETLTGQNPYPDVDNVALYGVIVRQAKFPTRPKSYIPPNIYGNMLWSLLSSCWARDLQERPSAAEVRDMMKTFTPEKLKHEMRS